jgi:hypothetical protein
MDSEDRVREIILKTLRPPTGDLPLLRMMREGEAELERVTYEMRLPAELLGPCEEDAPAYTLRRYALPIEIPPDNRTEQQIEADREAWKPIAEELLKRIVIRGVYR